MTTTCQRQALHGPAVEAAFHLFSVVPLLLVRQPLLEKTVQICTEADPRRRRADTMGIPLAPRILRLKRKRYTRNAPTSKNTTPHTGQSRREYTVMRVLVRPSIIRIMENPSRVIATATIGPSRQPAMAARTPVATIEGNQSRKHPIH